MNKPTSKPTLGLVTRILRSLLVTRGRCIFKQWFTDDEIALFRSGINQIHVLEPYFIRYQDVMETALKKICAEEGIGEVESEIMKALKDARDVKQLDKMVDSMTNSSIFYKLMRRRADKNHDAARRQFDGLKRMKQESNKEKHK